MLCDITTSESQEERHEVLEAGDARAASIVIIPHIRWKNGVTKCTIIDGGSGFSGCPQCSPLLTDPLMPPRSIVRSISGCRAGKIGACRFCPFIVRPVHQGEFRVW